MMLLINFHLLFTETVHLLVLSLLKNLGEAEGPLIQVKSNQLKSLSSVSYGKRQIRRVTPLMARRFNDLVTGFKNLIILLVRLTYFFVTISFNLSVEYLSHLIISIHR